MSINSSRPTFFTSSADLVIDLGMGLGSLKSQLRIPAGKPVLAVATHVHVDHIGSFHEFRDPVGP